MQVLFSHHRLFLKCTDELKVKKSPSLLLESHALICKALAVALGVKLIDCVACRFNIPNHLNVHRHRSKKSELVKIECITSLTDKITILGSHIGLFFNSKKGGEDCKI